MRAIKYISSGLEFLIGTSSIDRHSLNSKRNILVVVHQGQLSSDVVRDNLKREMKIFGENNIYYSNFNPYNCPIESDPTEKSTYTKKESFPSPENVGTVYIAGCYKEMCIGFQEEWLRENGYTNIVLIDNAIQSFKHKSKFISLLQRVLQ